MGEITWKDLAWKEIHDIKPFFLEKYGWEVKTDEDGDQIRLYVRMPHPSKDELKVLLLTYDAGFPQKRPREDFANPENYDETGTQFWINDGQHAFKSNHNPPVICLQGTWGFHHVLHKEKDAMKANLNLLLRDVQLCYNKT